MLDATSKALFHGLAQIPTLQRLASKYGMAPGSGFARRFIAGESVEEAVECVKDLPGKGLLLTLDYLGESVSSAAAAAAAAADYVQIIDAIVRLRRRAQYLAQVDAARASTSTGPRRSTTCAASSSRPMRTGFSCASTWKTRRTPTRRSTSSTRCGGRAITNVGTVIQSYLKRSTDDIRRLNALGARVRLVKGAYKEPKNVAYQKKSEVDAAFIELMRLLLDEGTYPAIATHDTNMIDATKAYAKSKGYANDRFEFQMLYGIRRDLQTALVKEGYRVRVYVPFGKQWYPYFMRRLGERPANVAFVLKGILSDKG